jgi:hypothetical protein
MSETHKDSAGKKRRDIVVKLEGDAFSVFQCGKVLYAQVSERNLNEILCRKWGYCGQEFDEILHEVRALGEKTLYF